MSDMLDRALEQSLEMLRQGRSVEECLDRFPQEAAELRPILMAFAPVRGALAAPMPPLARSRVRSTVMQAWDRRATSPARWWRLPWNVSRFAMSAAAVVIVLAFVGGTATYASGTALPGDLLYPVKQTREDVQLALARSPEAKVGVLDKLLDERADEVRALSRAGRVGGMAIAAERMQRQAEKLASLAEDVGAVSAPTATPGAVSPDGTAVPTPGLTPTPVSLPRTMNEEDQPVRVRVERVLAAHAAKAEALAEEVAPETLSGDQEEPKKAVGRALDSVSKTLKPARGETNPGGNGGVGKDRPADGDRGQSGKSDPPGRNVGGSKEEPTPEPTRRPDALDPTPDSRRDDEDRNVRPSDRQGETPSEQHKPVDTPRLPDQGPGLPVPLSPTPAPDAPAVTPPVTPLGLPMPTQDTTSSGETPVDGKAVWEVPGILTPAPGDPQLAVTPEGGDRDEEESPSSDRDDGVPGVVPTDVPTDVDAIAHPILIAVPGPIEDGDADVPPLPTVSPEDLAPADGNEALPDTYLP